MGAGSGIGKAIGKAVGKGVVKGAKLAVKHYSAYKQLKYYQKTIDALIGLCVLLALVIIVEAFVIWYLVDRLE